jgi:hypothetical protein
VGDHGEELLSGFAKHRKSGRIIADFTGFEAELLRSLAGQLVELLHNEIAEPREDRDPLEALLDFSGPTSEPEDPVLARLFPTAYADDDEAASEFRRFTEGALRDSKSRAAESIIDSLEEAGLPHELTEDGLHFDVELDEPEAITWMRSFTDIRLALATRWGSRMATRTTGPRFPTMTRPCRRTTSTSGSATCRRRSSRLSEADRRGLDARRGVVLA